ncbi:hypothetical protein CABS01_12651 [Colletotrichum abscissum]|uniref:uncharacterized protein n=1 Tax=Colletotrichum abscissum TaxID=1671311 RepID=UPI0027D4F9BE|nr:uncharacterized protein CABS01_12651 [Colletotrichum abscissum]KAK1489500.1 hypothetical protein CABS01_12651 [Colletotrichum abscissum]
MKSSTVTAIALLGLTNAATIRICKDQTLGNCVTTDVGGRRTSLAPSDSPLRPLQPSGFIPLRPQKREADKLATVYFIPFLPRTEKMKHSFALLYVKRRSSRISFRTQFLQSTCDGSCGGASWTTRGLRNTVPSNFNDNLSSVRC